MQEGKMGFFNRIFGKFRTRAEPATVTVGLADFESLSCLGYTRLVDNPEVRICVDLISDLVSNMTIYLMQNTEQGDVRIKNELSRKLDIEPYLNMTKKSWLYNIVHTMLLEGNGNSFVLPDIRRAEGRSYIANLKPLQPYMTSIIQGTNDYFVSYGGKIYESDEVLHFVLSPDPDYPYMGRGYRITLSDIVNNLHQASKTKSEFMTDKWRPSVIISVNGMTEEFENDTGREAILKKYISETGGGTKPWVIPDELIKVDQVRPLSLADLALNDAVELDKKTVAGIFGVPPFFVGAGAFNRDEYNNFIQTKILSIANIVQQTLTGGLLIDPTYYFKLNYMSLYSYSLDTLANMGMNLYTRGIATGNEVRDLIGMSPRDGLDELVILENYIPQGMIGNQNKLNGGGEVGK